MSHRHRKSIRHRYTRIISAAGPVSNGTVESMHIGSSAIQKAVKGQQVGIKIENFNKVNIGDLAEMYRHAAGHGVRYRMCFCSFAQWPAGPLFSAQQLFRFPGYS